MKFEVAWTENDEPIVRRADRQPMTPQDREEVKALLNKMLQHEVCWNCGAEWSEFTRADGRKFRVCWSCAKTV